MAYVRYPELQDAAWVQREYIQNGRSMLDIAGELACHPAAVMMALRRHGIEHRHKARPHSNGPTKHGHTRKGPPRYESPTYRTWQDMLNRCRNPRHRQWKYYGGRGITVCERWRGRDGFVNFLSDMGERPPKLSIDRINNDGNYEPGNCRWATAAQQVANSRPKGTC